MGDEESAGVAGLNLGVALIMRDDATRAREALLEAAELAVHFSRAKNAGRADVHVAPIKQVSKPKGAKPGLVWVRGGRSLSLRREPERRRR